MFQRGDRPPQRVFPLIVQTSISSALHFCNQSQQLNGNKNLILPKHVLLIDSGKEVYIGPEYTLFTEFNLKKYGLKQQELECIFVLSKDTLINDPSSNNKENTENSLASSSLEPNVTFPSMEVHDGYNDTSHVHNNHFEGDDVAPSNDDSSETSEFSGSFDTLPDHILRYGNMFLAPQHCSNYQILHMIHTSKENFLLFTRTIQTYFPKNLEAEVISTYSRAFLFRMKLATNLSFDKLGILFGIPTSTARHVFWSILRTTHEHYLGVPDLLSDDIDDPIGKVLREAYDATDPFFQILYGSFKDPKGLGRIGVPICTDGTYGHCKKPQDSELNKLLFYAPYNKHIIKIMTLTTAQPKILYVLANCASQSPASGDGVLIGHLIKMEEKFGKEAIKKLAEGSATHFPVFVVDAGYQYPGNLIKTPETFKDIRELITDSNAVYLGKYIYSFYTRYLPKKDKK